MKEYIERPNLFERMRVAFRSFFYRRPLLVFALYFLFAIPFLYFTMYRPEMRKHYCERSWNREEVRCVQYWMRHPAPIPNQ